MLWKVASSIHPLLLARQLEQQLGKVHHFDFGPPSYKVERRAHMSQLYAIKVGLGWLVDVILKASGSYGDLLFRTLQRVTGGVFPVLIPRDLEQNDSWSVTYGLRGTEASELCRDTLKHLEVHSNSLRVDRQNSNNERRLVS